MTTEDFLPLTIDVEQVTFVRVGGGWEIVMDTENETIAHWTDMPDGLYDQLVEKGYISHE